MPRRPDWRAASAVETLNSLDRAGFAWEFLRRNPRYRREYNQAAKEAASAASEAAGHRWGLSFRLRSQTRSPQRCGDLAAGAGASQCGSLPGAG